MEFVTIVTFDPIHVRKARSRANYLIDYKQVHAPYSWAKGPESAEFLLASKRPGHLQMSVCECAHFQRGDGQMTLTVYGVSPHLVNGANCHLLCLFRVQVQAEVVPRASLLKWVHCLCRHVNAVFILPPGRLPTRKGHACGWSQCSTGHEQQSLVFLAQKPHVFC